MRTTTTIPLSLLLLALAAAPVAQAGDGHDPDDYVTTTKCSMVTKKSYSMTALLRGRVKVKISCDGPAAVSPGMQIDRPQALDFRMPGNGIQDVWGEASFPAAGTQWVPLHMNKSSRPHLGRQDRWFSGKMNVAIGPYGTHRGTEYPAARRRVTFRR